MDRNVVDIQQDKYIWSINGGTLADVGVDRGAANSLTEMKVEFT
jgi:hypothetical protein